MVFRWGKLLSRFKFANSRPVRIDKAILLIAEKQGINVVLNKKQRALDAQCEWKLAGMVSLSNEFGLHAVSQV